MNTGVLPGARHAARLRHRRHAWAALRQTRRDHGNDRTLFTQRCQAGIDARKRRAGWQGSGNEIDSRPAWRIACEREAIARGLIDKNGIVRMSPSSVVPFGFVTEDEWGELFDAPIDRLRRRHHHPRPLNRRDHRPDANAPGIGKSTQLRVHHALSLRARLRMMISISATFAGGRFARRAS